MIISTIDIEKAAKRIQKVVHKTPLEFSKRLSKKYNAFIYLKREDLQNVRSFKIRGAYNKIALLTKAERKRGIVCASAGNHAQGVAYSCAIEQINGTVFMPVCTPKQKIAKVAYFGDKFVNIQLVGETFDEASKAAQEYCNKTSGVYVHAFDDLDIITGQGTIGKELYDEMGNSIDVVIAPIGGGGLIAGIASYLKAKDPNISIIGSEATGAPGMHSSLQSKKVISLATVDTFVDGTAVKTVGSHTFPICQELINEICVVPEGSVCDTLIELYQHDGIIAEPAGALAITALDAVKDYIQNKTVVCIISGGNNDLFRYSEIIERSYAYGNYSQ